VERVGADAAPLEQQNGVKSAMLLGNKPCICVNLFVSRKRISPRHEMA
jgi:hypothetical protein